MTRASESTIDTQSRARLLSAAGHQLAVIEPDTDATGPNVVFIHGITGDVNFWMNVLPGEIEVGMRWSSVSLPGHFPSTVPDGFSRSDVGSDMFADCIGDAIRQLYPNERVHLVGWSTGGFSSLVTAAKFPDLVASVSSISGFARGKWGNRLGNMQALARAGAVGRLAFRSGMRGMAINPVVFKSIFAGFSANPRKTKADAAFCDSLEPLRARFSRLDTNVMSLLFAGLHGTDASATIGNVTAPSLIIGGEADPIIPLSETQHVASLVRESTLVEVADCGHLFFCEAAERIWPRIIEWIRQHHG